MGSDPDFQKSRGRAPARVVVVVFGALVALAVPGLLRLRSDNSPEVFFPRGSKDVQRYLAFERDFGGDEGARLVFEGEALWSEAALRHVARVEEEASRIPGVRRVEGIGSHAESFADPEALRRDLAASPLATNAGTIARDASALTTALSLERLPAARSQELLARLEALVADPPRGLETSVVGGALVNRELDRSSAEIGTRYFPLLVAVTLVLLAAVFRSASGVVVPLAFVGACEALTLGAMGWAGVELNLVLAILPPLLFVIALATAVHVFARYRDLRGEGLDADAAVDATYADSGWALFWAGVTTVVGFGSLVSSSAGPVRQLGLWSAAGIALMTLAAGTLLPALLRAVRVAGPPHREDPTHHGFGGRLARLAVRHRRAVLLVTLVTSLAGGYGFTRLAVESNALHYFPKDDPVRARVESLERRGITVATLEVVLRGTERLSDVASLERLAAFGRRLREAPHVAGVVSAGDLFEEAMAEAGRRMPLPRSSLAHFARAALENGPLGDDLRALLADGDRATRVTVFVPQVGYEEVDELVAHVRRAAAEELPAAEVEVTGQYRLLLETQRALLRTLAVSLSGAVLCTLLLFWLALRSLRLAVIALVPNVWQVLVVVGAVGLAGVRVDIATVMVASIVVGISVDDTLRTIGHLRQLVGPMTPAEAVVETLERTAGAYVLTGGILVMGFGACALSSFVPIQRFGVLAAIAIALAVLADLVMLPALFAKLPESVVRKLVVASSTRPTALR